VKGFAYRRVKNDVLDAADLADLLRMDRLPEGWIAPPQVRELREMVRHRAKLVAWRSGLKASVHGVLAKQGLHPPVSDLFGVGGRQWLSTAPLDAAYRLRINALLRLIDAVDFEITAVAGPLRAALVDHAGFRAVQAVPGVGPVLAAIFVAEIGEVTRFASSAHLSSWAGLTPKHRESDTVVRRGPITKQGSTLVRWAAVEAAQGARNAGWLDQARTRIAERRGRNIATVAVARKLLTYVYYGLRDGRIRALEQTAEAA
jgi:transposase